MGAGKEVCILGQGGASIRDQDDGSQQRQLVPGSNLLFVKPQHPFPVFQSYASKMPSMGPKSPLGDQTAYQRVSIFLLTPCWVSDHVPHHSMQCFLFWYGCIL